MHHLSDLTFCEILEQFLFLRDWEEKRGASFEGEKELGLGKFKNLLHEKESLHLLLATGSLPIYPRNQRKRQVMYMSSPVGNVNNPSE